MVFQYYWNSTIHGIPILSILVQKGDPSRSETPWVKTFKFVMIMPNTDHYGISVLRKFDCIDYCDFHYHGYQYIAQL